MTNKFRTFLLGVGAASVATTAFMHYCAPSPVLKYEQSYEHYVLLPGNALDYEEIDFKSKYDIVKSKQFLYYGCDIKYIAKIKIPNNARIMYYTDDDDTGKDWTTTDRGEIYDTKKIHESPLFDEIMEHNPEFVRCLPGHLQTAELYERAMQERPNWYFYNTIPEKFRTSTVNRILIEYGEDDLYWIPEDERTPELCTIALRKSKRAIKYIPSDMRTPEIYDILLEGKGGGKYLSEIPKEYLTLERCKKAIADDGQSLWVVPKEHWDESLIVSAINSKSYYIADVLKFPITARIAEALAETHADAYRYVPQQLLTPELCWKMVKTNPMSIKYIPASMKTDELIGLSAIRG